jgi:hypothetical protein
LEEKLQKCFEILLEKWVDCDLGRMIKHTVNREMSATLKVGEFAFFQLALCLPLPDIFFWKHLGGL